MDPHIFVINLSKDTDRLAVISNRMARLSILFERIEAIYGTSMPDWLKLYFLDGYGNIASALLPGEVGCYASHLTACMRVTSRKLPHALILEDDVLVEDDAEAAIGELISKLPKGWDLVKLCNRRPSKPVLHLASLRSERILVRYSRHPILAGAYLISKAGAQKMLRPCLRTLPIDLDFHRPWRLGLNIFGVAPALFPQIPLAMGTNIGPSDKRAHSRKPLPFEQIQKAAYLFRTLGPAVLIACARADARQKAALIASYGPKKNWPAERPSGSIIRR